MIKPVLFLATLLLAIPASAQSNGTPREVQLKMLEHQRKVLLQMVDSMPERLYRDKVTPAQRDFAGQIHHAAGSAAGIARSVMKGPTLTLPDTSAAFNTRAGLRQYVSAAYDYAATLLKSQSEAARGETVDLFGNKMTQWQVWDEIHLHTVWTAGQIVANFRKHKHGPAGVHILLTVPFLIARNANLDSLRSSARSAATSRNRCWPSNVASPSMRRSSSA